MPGADGILYPIFGWLACLQAKQGNGQQYTAYTCVIVGLRLVWLVPGRETLHISKRDIVFGGPEQEQKSVRERVTKRDDGRGGVEDQSRAVDGLSLLACVRICFLWCSHSFYVRTKIRISAQDSVRPLGTAAQGRQEAPQKEPNATWLGRARPRRLRPCEQRILVARQKLYAP